MHASVRIYRALDVEKLLEKVEAEFVDRVKTIDGLIGYYVMRQRRRHRHLNHPR
jgi:sugar-specific transcriptional regulator TrmB